MEQGIGQYELNLALALIGCFAICWSVMFLSIRRNEDALKELMGKGNLLRMITVLFVVLSLGFLALTSNLTGEAATVFSGVAGYVLGGIGKDTVHRA